MTKRNERTLFAISDILDACKKQLKPEGKRAMLLIIDIMQEYNHAGLSEEEYAIAMSVCLSILVQFAIEYGALTEDEFIAICEKHGIDTGNIACVNEA